MVEHLDVLSLAFSSRGAVPADGELVLREVNGILRRLWPEAASSLYWTAPKTMIDQAGTRAGEDGPFFTTGGPLACGHRGAEWFISLRVVNAQSVELDAQEIVREADVAGLSAGWSRDPAGRETVLLASIVTERAPTFAEAAHWFEERLNELSAAGLLDEFLKAVQRKKR